MAATTAGAAPRAEEKKSAFEFDENKANETMDRFSRTVAELGVETMKNLTAMQILVIGQKGVGVETAKNLILGGPKAVHVWDDEKAAIADLGTNFYLRDSHVGTTARAAACVPQLAELNPYVEVQQVTGALTEDVIKRYGAVIVTEALPKELMYNVNKWARTNRCAYIMALTYGLTATFFSDFGDAHVITDPDGEPAVNLVVDRIDEFGVVTVTDEKHGLDDGAYVKFSEVEGMEFLNSLERVKIRRVTAKVADMDAKTQTQKRDGKGNLKWRTTTLLNKFQIDLSDSKELAAFFERKDVAEGIAGEGVQTFIRDAAGRLVCVTARAVGTYVKGGICTEVKPKTVVKFLSLPEALGLPCTPGAPVPHMDQMRMFAGKGTQLHYAYMAIHEFAARNGGNLPRLHNVDDAKAVVAVANDILGLLRAKGEGKAVTVEAVDADIVTKVSLFARAELPGLTAFLGGVAAQEVVKKFGKYSPVQQFLYTDYFELLPAGTTVPADRAPQGSRYDHQIAVFGKGFQDKIGSANWFLVGSGALGCEYLKGIALMGVGAGTGGMIHVTDMDRIELSNLSRQFLFRQKHVGKPKSRCSSEVAKEMNPGLNLTTYETKVCPETENLFDEKFWTSIHGVWNALDNIQARLYTDSQCVLYGLPLLESGTEGTKCNSSIHIPRITPSYSEGHNKNAPEGNIPACTLKNFPHLIIHCIEWARPRFSDIFELGPRNVNTLLQDKAKLFKQVEAEKHVGAKLELLQSIKSLLDRSTTRTFEACIQLAFEEFTQQFRNRILDLIHFQPEHSRVTKKSETGETIDLGPFWTGKQRFPSAASINLDDELQFAFLYNCANLYAFMFNIPAVRDQAAFKAKATEMKLTHPAWSPPKKAIDMSTDGSKKEEEKKEEKKGPEVDEEQAAIARILEEFKNLDVSKYTLLKEADFEKDDDTNFHIDYITSCSNMRAWNYKIQPATRLKCKVIAGKIIAALATTTALVSGLIEMEFYKIIMGLRKEKRVITPASEGKEAKTEDWNPYFNSNVNLATSTFNLFEVSEPAKTVDSFDQVMQMDIKAIPSGWTKWDKIIVDVGDITLGALLEAFPKIHHGCQLKSAFKHGLEEKDAGVFLFDTGDVYLGAEKKAAHQKRLTEKVSDLIQAVYPAKPGVTRKFFLLDCEATLEDVPVLVPVIKFQWAH